MTFHRFRRGTAAACVLGAAAVFLTACSSSGSATSGGSSSAPATAAAANATADFASELVNPGYLTVATTGTAPPDTMTDSSGKLVGDWPDITAAIAQKLGLKLRLQQIAWDGLLPAVTAHRADLGDGGILQTPARLSSKAFIVSSPFLHTGVTALVSKKSGITTWAQLKGVAIGVVSGETEGPEATDYLNSKGWAPSSTIKYAGHTDGLLGLVSGRVKALVLDSNAATYAAQKQATADGLTVIPDFIDLASMGTVYAPQEPKLAAAVDTIIKGMLADGSMATIITKWYGNTAPLYTGQ